ncbi:LUD domain-containing protein [Pseudomonas sp. D(2018)]|uniref:LutC/YkgG family protein n=1 Tax=Pseudomonas sp. D(2018) TaxID=2502238 RepID=UPI0010F86063|nr:LUD domain-containing protein [Pseudomonas sp. D(2018)]
MSNSRAAILDKVRLAVGRQPGDAPAPRPFSSAIALAAAGDLEQRLRERLAATGVTLECLPGMQALPDALAGYLARRRLEGPVALAPSLASLDWRDLPADVGSALPHHTVAVGKAFAGIAATGSLVMLADADNPPRLNFLPEHHLVVLSRSRLLARLEQLWPLLTGRDTQAVHLVTGPSSTADIGGQLLYGAHGPRAVHVLLTP